ncbi:Oidioi.mRNA.OKI2018_I69.chr2.g7072.t2.cds [Oikopleura dioica]|uniref:Oidioi.mRNA.OKI2018_I69.chr2.g7072.t2.cds n=1 Tax=Oikopleura dioica TaxID=34765 RepID=A0ABN7T5F8_OIKDI|nr:Oidioi.mRNA.OKI2018_I69.chr2.g7072.t2.cds [Oikopleura dioica]
MKRGDNLATKRSADEPLSGGASPKNARIAPGSPQSRSASLGDFHAAAVSDATPSGLSSLINFNTSSSEPSKSPTLTDEKKSRREIANCNERRRMQSINDGFARLKSLVPCIANEKVSKATILQQTAEHIEKESREKEQLKKIIKTFDPSYVFENDLKSSTREVSPDVSSLPTLVETKPIAPAPEPSLLNSLSALGGNNLEKTRQMLTQIQLLQAITQLQQNTATYNPLLPEQTSAKRETDVENNENNPVLNTLLQTMLQNALAQDSTHK